MTIIICLLIVFFLTKTSVRGYYPEERESLVKLRDSLISSINLRGNWTGSPCHNDASSWFGVRCLAGHVVCIVLEGIHLSGTIGHDIFTPFTHIHTLSFRNNFLSGALPCLINLPNLTHVIFSSNHFTGSIPSHYALLRALRELDLHGNSLNGQIPPLNQPTLTLLNLSHNYFTGVIPETSVLQRFPSTSYANNSPNLCGSTLQPCHVANSAHSHRVNHNSPINTLVLAVVLFVASLLGALVSFLYRTRWRRRTTEQFVVESRGSSASYSNPSDESEISVFDLDDLLRASSEMLGKGKIGVTYKATLDSGLTLAVKKVQNSNSLNKKQTIKHMQTLEKLRHENIAKLLSFFITEKENLIVYEFSPHGSLFDLLHKNRCYRRIALDWPARMSLIKDIAAGLAFLHQSLPSHKILHANLKSSNILIFCEQEMYRAKLIDFGFFPLVPLKQMSDRIAISRSPEFCNGRKVSSKSDVYCFGIVLLEIITGKIPHNSGRKDDLSEWVREVVNQDWSTDIFDVEIAAEDGHDDMVLLTDVALQCTNALPESRPSMTSVVERIQDITHKS